VIQKGTLTQISIDPSFLVPWTPIEGNKIVIIRYHWIRQVGKLVKLDYGYCAVELLSSSELLYFTETNVVNLLNK
jgi:hypothetical protein